MIKVLPEQWPAVLAVVTESENSLMATIRFRISLRSAITPSVHTSLSNGLFMSRRLLFTHKVVHA
jgi:hypothetical protein